MTDKMDMDKDFNRMSEEEIIREALKGAHAYISDIGHKGQFIMENCLAREYGRIEELFRASRGLGRYTRLDGRDRTELDLTLAYFGPILLERTLPIRDRFHKQKAVSAINAATAGARIRAAFGAAGIEVCVTEQKYRVRVTATLSDGLSVRFYVNYGDLSREGLMEELVEAVGDIRAGVARLGHGVALTRQAKH